MFVLDSHCDTPSQIMRLRNLGIDNPYAHVDFRNWREGEWTLPFSHCSHLARWRQMLPQGMLWKCSPVSMML